MRLVLVQLFVRSRHLYRTQAAAVLVAALAPWTVALSQQYFLQVPEDATIFAWGISGLAMTTGLYTFETLDPVPAAQETIVEQMGDGALVVDTDGRISHANPAAESLLAGAEAHGWELTITEGEDGGARFEFSGIEAASRAREPAAGRP